ncbi:MAG TPA: MarR family transcriptional regulator [Puia sp.]|jgi:DNA-binding MarR family transcriptional regulator|nr:MarR family transcriptional regulator [Puia sp.]
MTRLKDLDVYKPYSDSLYFSSASLARQTEKLAREIWARSGLPPSHAHLLWVIMNTEYRYPTIFSKSLSLSKSTITRLLEKLEQDGFVTRSIYGHLTIVDPTAKAWKLLPILMACEKTFDEHCNNLLGEEEAARLACAMDKAADKLREREECT